MLASCYCRISCFEVLAILIYSFLASVCRYLILFVLVSPGFLLPFAFGQSGGVHLYVQEKYKNEIQQPRLLRLQKEIMHEPLPERHKHHNSIQLQMAMNTLVTRSPKKAETNREKQEINK